MSIEILLDIFTFEMMNLTNKPQVNLNIFDGGSEIAGDTIMSGEIVSTPSGAFSNTAEPFEVLQVSIIDSRQISTTPTQQNSGADDRFNALPHHTMKISTHEYPTKEIIRKLETQNLSGL